MNGQTAGESIVVRDVGQVYAARSGPPTVALDHVDLTVPRGRFVSVIGPSGCGKSTLLRVLAGLEEPRTGSVSVFGATPAAAAAAKSVGFVPQVPALLPWSSVLQNVQVLGRVNRAAGRRRPAPPAGCEFVTDPVSLLTRLGLQDVLHARPAELSGGMQQRTALARALALQPDVLLMDEPFSALDEFTREAAQLQLLDVWSELRTTVVFVTHSITEAVLLSDTVVVMASGPGRIATSIPVDLARPRHHGQLDSSAMHALEHRVRQALGAAYAEAGVLRGSTA
ncbi:ABC transporter ATP-binding protein [Kineococcus gynurae]|uniref:ABC transporter ATP-binding protein n=1 Tax=Kineococcus gynurae TaxID=452979 RepID=A0ABV5LXL2_9ACTN